MMLRCCGGDPLKPSQPMCPPCLGPFINKCPHRLIVSHTRFEPQTQSHRSRPPLGALAGRVTDRLGFDRSISIAGSLHHTAAGAWRSIRIEIKATDRKGFGSRR